MASRFIPTFAIGLLGLLNRTHLTCSLFWAFYPLSYPFGPEISQISSLGPPEVFLDGCRAWEQNVIFERLTTLSFSWLKGTMLDWNHLLLPLFLMAT